MIRVGLVGYGLGGKVFHAPLIRACRRMVLAAVMTSRELPGAVGTLPELIDRSDLVVVSTPNESHFTIAQAALEAGKHVVVDKPFTVSLDEADALIVLAAARQRVLTVFHNRRWDGDFLAVRKVMPRLGAVRLAEMHWDRFRPAIKPGWREVSAVGAGLLNDLGPHMIDQMLLLFGRPEAIFADIVAQRDGAEVDDYFELTLHYGAMRVVIGASSLVAEPRPRFALHGSAGNFVKQGLDGQESALRDGADAYAAAAVKSPEGVLTLADGSREAVRTEHGRYFAFYEAVADSILDGRPVPVDPADARDGMLLISLARASASAGRRIAVPAASSMAR